VNIQANFIRIYWKQIVLSSTQDLHVLCSKKATGVLDMLHMKRQKTKLNSARECLIKLLKVRSGFYTSPASSNSFIWTKFLFSQGLAGVSGIFHLVSIRTVGSIGQLKKNIDCYSPGLPKFTFLSETLADKIGAEANLVPLHAVNRLPRHVYMLCYFFFIQHLQRERTI